MKVGGRVPISLCWRILTAWKDARATIGFLELLQLLTMRKYSRIMTSAYSILVIMFFHKYNDSDTMVQILNINIK